MLEINERMVGVRILIVDRVFGEMVDLRGFELSKIIIKFLELICDSVFFRVFLGDKICLIVS